MELDNKGALPQNLWGKKGQKALNWWVKKRSKSPELWRFPRCR